MPHLSSQIHQYIRNQRLFTKDNRLLLAISGGVDSVVLAYLLKESGYQLELAHCNFGLRGKESDGDEDFVKALAEELDIVVHTKRFDTEHYAKEHKVSTQMAARELRYNWFEELLNSKSLDFLITAHHAGDQTETTLFNWVKGTGVKGMRGISPKQRHVVRPLLFATKQEIIEYADKKGIKWREDVSNESNKYHRNKLRNLIIPSLKEINPNIDHTIAVNTERFRSMEELLASETKLIKKTHLYEYTKSTELRLNWLHHREGGLVILENILSGYGFNFDQTKSIYEGFEAGSGQTFKTKDYLLTLDRTSLYIEPHEQDYEDCLISSTDESAEILGHHFSFEILEMPSPIIKNAKVAMLDADLLHFPIKGRSKCDGDRFVPLGMAHQKKVSDFMIDVKIPVNLKKRTVIFESNDDIIWIAGHRISDKYKVTAQTQRCLIIKLLHDA